MNSARAVTLCCLLAFLHSALQAGEPVGKLPDDGWWARYFVTTRFRTHEIVNESRLKRTVSLVGTVTERDEKCRWVEITTDVISTVGLGTEKEGDRSIAKFLIPERDLLESDQPLDRLERCWIKTGDREVTAPVVESPQAITIRSVNWLYDTRLLFFPGVWQKSEPAEEQKIVEYQSGRLTIGQARTGKVTGKSLRVRGGALTSTVDFTIWTDPLVPGLAAANILRTMTRANNEPPSTENEEWIVEDFGTNAKSQLGDHN
ncbi:MAG: hypothetical protein ACT4QC_12735 [Planctomycetaceae bacterium]